jgi:hypothetical protein
MKTKYTKADFEALPQSIRAKALDIAQRAYESAAYMGHSNPDAYAAKKHDQYLIDYMDGDDSDVHMYDRCPDYAQPVQHAYKHR